MQNYWYWINFLMWNKLVITFYKSSYDLERIERQNISLFLTPLWNGQGTMRMENGEMELLV